MHAEGFVGALDAHGHVDPALHLRIALVFLAEFRRRRLLADHLLELGGLAPHHRDQLGEAVGVAIGDVEHPRHILQHRLGGHAVEGDDLGHLVVAIAAGHVVDHLTTALDAEVGVDIWHRLALGIEEALEQQPVGDRIDVGDAQGIGHQRPGGGAAAGPHRDAALPGEADVIPHHQEVGGEAHLLHHLQLKGQALAVGGFKGITVGQPQPGPQPLLAHLLQVAHRGVALGDRETGHLVAPEDVVVLHRLGHPGGVGHGFGHHLRLQVVGEQAEHLLLTLDVFGARVAQPLLIGDQLAGEDAEQGVVGLGVVAGEVVGVVGGDQRDAQLLADAHQLHVDDAVLGGAVVLDLQVEVVAEHALVPAGHISGDVGAVAQDRLGEFAAQAGGGHDQTLTVLLEGGLVDAGTGEDATAAHAAQVADAGELHQVAIAHGVLGQHHQVVTALLLGGIGVVEGTVDHVHLVADDRLHGCAAAQLQQLDGAIHHPVVGEGEGGHAQLLGPLDHGRQLAGPIQEAVVAVVVERNEGQGANRSNRSSGTGGGFRPQAKGQTLDVVLQGTSAAAGRWAITRAACS